MNAGDITVTVESLQRLMSRRDDAVAEANRLRTQVEQVRAQRDAVLSLHRPHNEETPRRPGDDMEPPVLLECTLVVEVCAECNNGREWPCATVLALSDLGR